MKYSSPPPHPTDAADSSVLASRCRFFYNRKNKEWKNPKHMPKLQWGGEEIKNKTPNSSHPILTSRPKTTNPHIGFWFLFSAVNKQTKSCCCFSQCIYTMTSNDKKRPSFPSQHVKGSTEVFCGCTIYIMRCSDYFLFFSFTYLLQRMIFLQ